ncbi:SRPBCC family protein [Yoonia sediminilitoris]|uniref:Polyketide cyclase/dehydrase/lipid transport protein n=1 Tax=Yoonia sediminilitoris TaxID=1286148 RepID=A0A2T6K6U1_9RHOB|nr:polyketide cyclase/dehydrase/lipid transport protein [Yoonia sediminilitoris]RCW89867.1 polyketide cyclase/dehydrase/lipid transport protein [Yoonia sediminilitoris]
MLIEDRIHISCPADLVWAITIDINGWPNWVPTIRHAQVVSEGPFGVGSKAVIKQPAQPKTLWRVVEFSPKVSFVWETSGRLLRMRAKHHLSPVKDVTECYTSIQIEGPLSPLLGPILRYPIKQALRQENKALKIECEGSDRALSLGKYASG